MSGEFFLKFVRDLTFGFLLIILCALVSHAQTNGTVGIRDQEITVFTAQTTTLSTGGIWQCNNSPTPIHCPFLQDIGPGANYLTYCNTNFKGTIDLEWAPTGSVPFLILKQASYQTADNACHQLQLGGYFPNMRSTVTPVSGSLSAWYTALAAPIAFTASALGSNGDSSPISCDLGSSILQTTAGTGLLASPINATDVVVLCGLTVSFNGATSAGTIGVYWSASSACTSLSAPPTWLIYTTSSTPQTIVVPIQQRNPNTIQEYSDNSLRNYACVTNSSGAEAAISTSWASVHGL